MLRRSLLVAVYGLLGAAGAVLGVLGAFLHLVSVDLGGMRVPVLLPLLAGALGALTFGGAALCGRRLGAVLPAATWLGVTLLVAGPRPEGDVVITGGLTSLAYLLVCLVVAGVAVGAGRARRRG